MSGKAYCGRVVAVRGRFERRYVALSAVVVALMVAQTLRQQWSTDLWEHSAAVRELARHPFDPHQPLYGTSDPHLSFGPYSWLAGLVVRATGWSPLTMLSVFAIVSLLVLLAAFGVFTRLLLRRPGAP